MKKTHFLALMFAHAALACGSPNKEEQTPPEAKPEEPVRVDPAKPAGAEERPSPLSMGEEGSVNELRDALARGEIAFVVVRAGAKAGDRVVGSDEDNVVARAVRFDAESKIVVSLLAHADESEVTLPVEAVRYLKNIDLVRLGMEVDRVSGVSVQEIDDFDLDEAARRATTLNGIQPAEEAKDFDCIVRFAQISASRDFVPFPLTNCSAPQDPVGDAERIADAQKAKSVAQNIYNKMVADYNNAQAMIAALNARLEAIRNAFVFVQHHPHFKEYNILHFKNFLHGRKSYNDRYKRAVEMLTAAARAVEAQIAMYQQVPPPSLPDARSQANYIVARKWNCVLKQGLLNNGGRSGSTIVGVSLETLGAPFVDIQVMLDDHPPLPQDQGWGGLFNVTSTANLNTDVTRLPVSSFIPVRASVGLPIVMFRFQPLDAKKTRPVGKACNLRAGIVL